MQALWFWQHSSPFPNSKLLPNTKISESTRLTWRDLERQFLMICNWCTDPQFCKNQLRRWKLTTLTLTTNGKWELISSQTWPPRNLSKLIWVKRTLLLLESMLRNQSMLVTMEKLIGANIISSPQSKTKVHVVHVGLSLPLLLTNLIKFSTESNLWTFPWVNNNWLIVQQVNHMEITVAMEVMLWELLNILRIMVKLSMLLILIKLSIKTVELPQVTSDLSVLLRLLDALKSKLFSRRDPLPLESMPPTGKPMPQVFSTTVIKKSTTLSSWLDQMTKPGLSRTLGVLHGENKDISDLPRVILVQFVKDLPSLSDLSQHQFRFTFLLWQQLKILLIDEFNFFQISRKKIMIWNTWLYNK